MIWLVTWLVGSVALAAIYSAYRANQRADQAYYLADMAGQRAEQAMFAHQAQVEVNRTTHAWIEAIDQPQLGAQSSEPEIKLND
jgi:hypothetical protein